MKIIVFGANGQIGRRTVRKLVEKGWPVRAMVRHEDQSAALEADGAEVVVADLEGEFAGVVQGCDAAVFTAGSGGNTGGDKTLLVDLWAALKSYSICREAGVRRYLMVSALRADTPDAGPPVIRHYLVAKKVADDYLRYAKLDYTILRPGRLNNEAGTGRIQFNYDPSHFNNQITRDDVAETILACLEEPRTIGKTLNLLNGDTPIRDAIADFLPTS